jgi:hypothetical protein
MWLSTFYTTKYTISIHVLSTDLKSIMNDTWKLECYRTSCSVRTHVNTYLQSIISDGYVYS